MLNVSFFGHGVGYRFFVAEALNNGLMPIVWGRPQPQTILNSYVSLYLTQEVAKEGLVKKLDDFSRFLEAMSFSHGQQLNLSNIAHECQVKRKTNDGVVGTNELLVATKPSAKFLKKEKSRFAFLLFYKYSRPHKV